MRPISSVALEFKKGCHLEPLHQMCQTPFMGDLGYGYGSECHLLRWMGRHRHALDQAVLHALSLTSSSIDWLDFDFASGRTWADAELKGLEFLTGVKWAYLQAKWAEFWPLGSGIHNWDAVGWLNIDGGKELLLVEAKAHTGEIHSDCQAKATASQTKIQAALDETKKALGVTNANDWTKGYYQYTNRLATLNFLNRLDIKTHLLFIYFVGDLKGAGRDCPQTVEEWSAALKAQDDWVGLPTEHPLKGRIHKMFLRVDGGNNPMARK